MPRSLWKRFVRNNEPQHLCWKSTHGYISRTRRQGGRADQKRQRIPIGQMSVRTSTWRLRRQLRYGSGSGGVGFSRIFTRRAASTSSTETSAETSAGVSTETPTSTNALSPAKKNGYNPPPVPISPLMDPNKYIKISRRFTKPQRPKGNEPLSPEEEALKTNPYGSNIPFSYISNTNNIN